MTQPGIDMDRLNRWLGREEAASDVVTPGLVERFRATFGGWLRAGDDEVPPGLHWCLAPPAVPRGDLGPDGHPARGGFLPPVPLPSRMWAGGDLRLLRPLRIGDTVTRRSRIGAITPKEGRSGPLVFVAVHHVLSVGGAPVIEERHDIVYRPARTPAAQSAPDDIGAPVPEGGWVGDAVTLFRYSAMTFNGHRIHYDRPYATEVEFYPGLVVHGPIQATLLLNAAAARAGPAFRFAYRGVSPLIAGQPVTLHAQEDRLRLERLDGTVTFEASHSPI